MDKRNTSGLAPVKGIDLYYQIHGEGAPLILLHGGFGAVEMFGPLVGEMAKGRQVIGVDLQAHGRTVDIDRPMTYENMADDVAGLIDYLGLGQADVMGYSLGGGVAMQVTIRHPDKVRKVIAVSTPFRHDGWYPDVVTAMRTMGPHAAEGMKQTPMFQLYAQIAPRVEDFPRLCAKIGDCLRTDYDWSEQIEAITAPVLIVAGDGDSVQTSHLVEFFQLLGGGLRDAGWTGEHMARSRLAILPGLTHYNIFASPALASTATAFLDA
jgi:pimeloyl-ACP methyl ester carboxylesterase